MYGFIFYFIYKIINIFRKISVKPIDKKEPDGYVNPKSDAKKLNINKKDIIDAQFEEIDSNKEKQEKK